MAGPTEIELDTICEYLDAGSYTHWYLDGKTVVSIGSEDVCNFECGNQDRWRNNALFIIEASEMVPRLVAEVRRLRAIEQHVQLLASQLALVVKKAK